MSIQTLKDIALSQISVRQAMRADPQEKGVLAIQFRAKVAATDGMAIFNESLDAVQGHVCMLRNYSVWHGSLLGPRKFRNKTLCKCQCLRLGNLCECDCIALIKMVMEYREAEIFRGYRPGQRKHKKCPRFISKKTTLGRLLEGQFQDTLPEFTSQ